MKCSIPARYCSVELATGGGDARVDAAKEAASLRVDTAGGSVALGSVHGGELSVNTGGGALSAKSIQADSSIDTRGGLVTVRMCNRL